MQKVYLKSSQRFIAVALALLMSFSGIGWNTIKSVHAEGTEPKKTISLAGNEIDEAVEVDVRDEQGKLIDQYIKYNYTSATYDKNTINRVELGNASGQQSDVLYMDFGSAVEFEYNSEVSFETYFSTSDGQYKSGYTSIYQINPEGNAGKVLILGSGTGGSTLNKKKKDYGLNTCMENDEYIGDSNIYYVITPKENNPKSGTIKIFARYGYSSTDKYNSYIHFYGAEGQLDYTLTITVMSQTNSYILEESTLDVRQGRNATIDAVGGGTDGYNWFILKGSNYSTGILKTAGRNLISDSAKVLTDEEQEAANGTVSPRVSGGVTKADSSRGIFNAYSDRGIGDIYVLTETNSGIDATDEKNKCVALLGRKLQCITRLGISEWRKAIKIGFLKDGSELSQDGEVEYNFLINTTVRLDNLVIGHTGKFDGQGNEIKTNDYFHFKLDGKTVNYKSENEKIAEYKFNKSGEYILQVSTEDEKITKSCKIIISQPTSKLITYKNEISDNNIVGNSEATGQSSTSATVRYNNEISLLVEEDAGANEPLNVRVNNALTSEYLSISEPEKLANNIFKYTFKVIKDVDEEKELNINISTARDRTDSETPATNINVAFMLKVYPSSSGELKAEYTTNLSGYNYKNKDTGVVSDTASVLFDNDNIDLYEGEKVDIITEPENIGNEAPDQIIYNIMENSAFIEKTDSSKDQRATSISWVKGSGEESSLLKASALSSQIFKKNSEGDIELDENGNPIPEYIDSEHEGQKEYLSYSKNINIPINTKIKTSKVTLALGQNPSTNPTVNVNGDYDLIATVAPENTDETLYWKSVDSSKIVFVKDDGSEVSEIYDGGNTVKIRTKSRTDDDPNTVNGSIIQAYTMHKHGNRVHISSKLSAAISIRVKEAGAVRIEPDDWTSVYKSGTQYQKKNLTVKVYDNADGDGTPQTNPTVDWRVKEGDERVLNIDKNQGSSVTATTERVGTAQIIAKSGTTEGYSTATITAPFTDGNITLSGVNTNVDNTPSEGAYIYLPNGIAQPDIKPVLTAGGDMDSRADADGNYVLKEVLDEGGDYIITDSFKEGDGIGRYSLTFTQGTTGLYTGTRTENYRIYPKTIGSGYKTDAEIKIVQVGELIYNATSQKPELIITYQVGEEKQILVKGTDYTMSTEAAINAGEHEVTITGKGNFTGSVQFKYEIKPFDLEEYFEKGQVAFYNQQTKEYVTEGGIADQTYTTKAITPIPSVCVKYDGFDKFSQPINSATNTTYIDLAYENNVNAGIATITITGKENYTGEISTTFNILPKNISVADNMFKVGAVAEQEYTGFEITPEITATYNGEVLIPGLDYTLSYQNNIDSYVKTGNQYAVITIKGRKDDEHPGNYIGEREVKFKINQVNLSDSTKVVIDPIEDQYDCGTFLRPEISVHCGDYKLVEGVDYTTFYGKDNGTDLEYNYSVGAGKGVVAILPVDKGNFRASAQTDISRKYGQEIFFNIVDKNINNPADSITIKRIVPEGESTDLLKEDTIFVNAMGGVGVNTIVKFDIEAICSDGDCDDPIYAFIPDAYKGLFTCNVETLDISKGNKAILTITGGNKAANGEITIKTKGGTERIITVVVNDPATKVQLSYDKNKTDMKNHVKSDIANGVTEVRERHKYQLIANLSRGTKDTVTWKSKDESVATVDEFGCVTALKKGSTIITATTNPSELYDGGVQGYVTMNVSENVMAESISIEPVVDKIRVGKQAQLVGTAVGKDGRNVTENLVWHSDNENIVEIVEGKETSVAVIKAIDPGKTTIHYGSEFEDGKEASFEIVAYEPQTSISIKTAKNATAADVGIINGVVDKSNTVYGVVVDEELQSLKDAKVEWTIGNPNVLEVVSKDTNNCQVELKFKQVGNTTIKVTSADLEETYNVTVTAPINGSRKVDASTTVPYVNVSGIEDRTYLPNGMIPEFKEEAISSVDSRGDNYKLINGNDYISSNSYPEGGKVGTYKYTLSQVSGGFYTGSQEISYKILQKSLGDGINHDGEIDVDVTDVVYNGKPQIPELSIIYKNGDNEQKLVQGQDYTVSQGYTDAGEDYVLTITAANNSNFKGSFKVNYSILPFDLKANLEKSVRFVKGNDLVESGSIQDQIYTGSAITPNKDVLIRASFDEGKSWTGNLVYDADNNKDVNYSYTNNINAGTATVTITGTKNYTGTISTTFEIVPKDITSGVTFANVANQEYTSKEVTPDISSKYNSMTLVKDIDYTLDYDNNVDSYNVTKKDSVIKVSGKGNYTGYKEVKFKIDQVDISDKTKVIIDEIPDQYECGTFLRPDVTARYGDYVLVEGKDYTTFYGKDNGIKDLSTNINFGTESGVVAILPVTTGNFKATKSTTVSNKSGQEVFFNIIDKDVQHPADDIVIKRKLEGGNADLIDGAIYVNASGGVSKNTTVAFDIEAICDDGDCDDPVFIDVPSEAEGKFTCSVRTLDNNNVNKAVLEITGGTKQAQSYITLMTKKGMSKDITVIVNDPATKVDIAYATNNPQYVDKPISNNTTTVFENHDYQLIAKLSRGTTDSVTWSSSDESVAIVDDDGRVTTLKPGSIRITATTKGSELYEGGVKGVLTFNIKKNVMAHSVTIDSTELTLEKGKTKMLTGTATPQTGTTVTEKLEWTTSDEKIVKIIQGQDTNKATIEAVSPGTAKVYYGSKDQENGVRGYCEVTVFVPVTSLTLDTNSTRIEAGDTVDLTATLNEYATDKFIWETSDSEIASIEVSNTDEVANSQKVTIRGITPKKSATITVKAASNNKAVATCKVDVIDKKADNVTIDKTSITVNAGETFKLKGSASSTSGDVTESLIWGFPSNKIDCIEGEFTTEPTFRAKQTSGTATITYGSNDQNGKIARCEVTILGSSISLDTSKVTIAPDGTAKLTASYPTGSEGGFKWTSSDEDVVKINGASGAVSNSQTVEIVGCGPGKTAQITVASVDDAKIKAVCEVTVSHVMADIVTIDTTSLKLKVGDVSGDLVGSAVSNTGALITEPLGWSTSNSAVVSIVGDVSLNTIKVKAVSAGTATITYGSKMSGGKVATCTVVVNDSNGGSGGNGGNQGGNNGGNQGGNSGNTDANTLTPGKTTSVDGVTYVVNADNTVTYAGNPKAKGTVKIPETVKIGNKTVNVTSVKANAFKNNKTITAVVIGKNVKTIEKNAFMGCTKLKKVTIGANVTTIGNNAFKGCTSLTKIAIPAKVTSIGNNAFAGCSKLITVTIKATKLKKIGKGAFKTINKLAKIKCPKAKLKAYTKMLNKSGVPKKAKITK
ncbi:MAG: leucine-rich repeat protein [Eubacterium sp.]|nr:leucine-rich repeat protein [Eubacterium sp.]